MELVHFADRRAMLRKLASSCDNAHCPTVFSINGSETDVIVQGYIVGDADLLAALELPEGEIATVIPASLLREAAEASSRLGS